MIAKHDDTSYSSILYHLLNSIFIFLSVPKCYPTRQAFKLDQSKYTSKSSFFLFENQCYTSNEIESQEGQYLDGFTYMTIQHKHDHSKRLSIMYEFILDALSFTKRKIYSLQRNLTNSINFYSNIIILNFFLAIGFSKLKACV